MGVEGGAGYFFSNTNQFSENATVTDQFGIATNVGRRRYILSKGIQIPESTDIVEFIDRLERFKDRDDIGGLARHNQLPDVSKDQTMIFAIDIGLFYDIDDFVPCGIVYQQSTQHGLLCLEGMRRQL